MVFRTFYGMYSISDVDAIRSISYNYSVHLLFCQPLFWPGRAYKETRNFLVLTSTVFPFFSISSQQSALKSPTTHPSTPQRLHDCRLRHQSGAAGRRLQPGHHDCSSSSRSLQQCVHRWQRLCSESSVCVSPTDHRQRSRTRCTHDDGRVQRPDWPPEPIRRPSGHNNDNRNSHSIDHISVGRCCCANKQQHHGQQ